MGNRKFLFKVVNISCIVIRWRCWKFSPIDMCEMHSIGKMNSTWQLLRTLVLGIFSCARTFHNSTQRQQFSWHVVINLFVNFSDCCRCSSQHLYPLNRLISLFISPSQSNLSCSRIYCSIEAPLNISYDSTLLCHLMSLLPAFSLLFRSRKFVNLL